MRENRIRFFNINFLRRVLLLLGCLLFLWSVVVPFYQYIPVTLIETHYSILFWSFRLEIYSYGLSSLERVTQKWFIDCWFGNSYLNYLGVSWSLIAIFVCQIATLLMGMVLFFNTKKIIAVLPVATCLTTALLMVYTNILLSRSNLLVYFYQLGYWLTYPSLVVFITHFLLTIALRTSKTR